MAAPTVTVVTVPSDGTSVQLNSGNAFSMTIANTGTATVQVLGPLVPNDSGDGDIGGPTVNGFALGAGATRTVSAPPGFQPTTAHAVGGGQVTVTAYPF